MIASVSGVVAAVAGDTAVIEVGGVGLSVHCAPGTLAALRVGATARLATSLIVREDSLTLYGFADDDEKHLFELLQTVERRRPAAGPGGARRAQPRRRPQGARQRRRGRARAGAGHRHARAPSG